MGGSPEVLGGEFVALPDDPYAAPQRSRRLLQQLSLPLPTNQATLTRAEIFLGEGDQACDQFGDAITPTAGNPVFGQWPTALIQWPTSSIEGPRLGSIEIDLVANQPDRRGALVRDPLIECVGQPQHQVRLPSARPRTTNALLLHGILALANAGGIDDRHWIAVEVEVHLDDVACGAGMRRDDCNLAPRQLIDQGRLADIRRTGDRNHKPVAKPFASALRGKDFLDFRKQHRDLRKR